MKQLKILYLLMIYLMIGLLIGCGKENHGSDDPKGPGEFTAKIVLEKNEIKLGEDLKVRLYYGTRIKRLADLRYKIDGEYASEYYAQIEMDYGRYDFIYPGIDQGDFRKEKVLIKEDTIIYKEIEDFCSANYPDIYFGIDENSRYEDIIIPSYIFTEENGYVRVGVIIYGLIQGVPWGEGVLPTILYHVIDDKVVIHEGVCDDDGC